MVQDVLTIAWKFMRRRKFATAIKLLEAREETYEGNFEYYLLLGITCLYVGDIGSAVTYFQRARQIKINDSKAKERKKYKGKEKEFIDPHK